MSSYMHPPLKATLNGLLGLALILNPLAVTHAATDPANSDGDTAAETATKPALTVTTVSPQQESWDISITADGTINPWQEASVAAEISGLRIVEVLADVGETVKKGQPLVKLANESIQAEIDQQQAVIAQSKSEIARAESAVVQAEAVVAQAKAGIVQAESGVAQARMGVKQAEAGVDQAQLGVIQAQVGVNQAQAGVTQSEAGLAQVGAAIQQADANLNQAGAGIAQANAGLAQANANFQDAKANADRARKLKSTGALPLQQVDQYLTNEKTSRAGVESQKAAVNAQRSTLEAQKAALLAQKAGLTAKKAEAEARRADIVSAQTAVKVRASEVKSQQIAVEVRLQDVKTQEAAVDVQRAALTMQEAALRAQQVGVESLRAALKVQEAALRSREIRMEQTTLHAPDDGVISSRTAALGAVVQPGIELFRLIRNNKLEWRAEVSSNDLGKITEQQAASITLGTGEVVEGQVRLISPQLDANTRRAYVHVSLPEGSSARAGMFVQGTIRQGQTEAVSLPQSAVILRDGRNYIFAVDDDEHITQMAVKTGRRVQDRVEILDKLPARLKVVSTGAAFLNDGDRVQVSEGGKTP